MFVQDYYKILQVDPLAEPEVIDAAYKRLMLKYHPDQNKSPDSTIKAQALNKAYTVLRDPIKRREYDQLCSLQKNASSNYYGSNNSYRHEQQSTNSSYEERRKETERQDKEEKQRAYRAEEERKEERQRASVADEARKVREKEEQTRRAKEEQERKENEAFDSIEKAAKERREIEALERQKKDSITLVLFMIGLVFFVIVSVSLGLLFE